METQVANYTLTRALVARAIRSIRSEWEAAASGDSLVETKGNVGYLLVDVAVALGLTGDDLKMALGGIADELS